MRNPFSRRQPPQPDPVSTGAALLLPYSQISRNMQRQLDSFGRAMQQVAATIRVSWPQLVAMLQQFADALNPYIAANELTHVAGLEARYFVRAGLDPTYAAPRALDLLVQQILLGVGDDLRWVNDENRSLIAAAALSGWVGSYAGGSTVRVLAWHRRIGDTHITVGRAS